MLRYVVIAVTCRRPLNRYTHDDGGGGLAGLNARNRKTVPRVMRECELAVAVAPETRLLNEITCLTRPLFNQLDLGLNVTVLLSPSFSPYPPPHLYSTSHKVSFHDYDTRSRRIIFGSCSPSHPP